MAAIRLIQKPENGKLIITVPDEMRDETMIIELWPAREEKSGKSLAEVSQAFFNKLQRPNPNFDWDSLNVYEQ